MELDAKLRRVRFLVLDVDGVLTDGKIWYDGEGRPFRALHARDATGITLWHLAGYGSAFVSGLGSKAIEVIAHQWRVAECHMWIKDKARVCAEIAERHGVNLDEMAFVGDDIIDLRAMASVGVGFAVADALPEIRQKADLLLETPGGQGAIREAVHRILAAQGCLDETVQKYLDRKDHMQ